MWTRPQRRQRRRRSLAAQRLARVWVRAAAGTAAKALPAVLSFRSSAAHPQRCLSVAPPPLSVAPPPLVADAVRRSVPAPQRLNLHECHSHPRWAQRRPGAAPRPPQAGGACGRQAAAAATASRGAAAAPVVSVRSGRLSIRRGSVPRCLHRLRRPSPLWRLLAQLSVCLTDSRVLAMRTVLLLPTLPINTRPSPPRCRHAAFSAATGPPAAPQRS
jgi:hypothetical protein